MNYSRQKIRFQNRIEKYSLQCFGAKVFYGLQNLEIQVKDYDFWKPKGKYKQAQQMVQEYECEQDKIKNIRENERYKENQKTRVWLRDKKNAEIERRNKKTHKQNILDLLFLHAEYLKKGAHKKWVSLKCLYNQIEKSMVR